MGNAPGMQASGQQSGSIDTTECCHDVLSCAPCSAQCRSGERPSAAGRAPPPLLLLGWPPGPPATPPPAPPHPRLLRGAARAAAAAAARGRRCPGRAPLRGRAAPARAPRCRPPSCQACGAMQVAGGRACGGRRLHVIPGPLMHAQPRAQALASSAAVPCIPRSFNCSGQPPPPLARVSLGCRPVPVPAAPRF